MPSPWWSRRLERRRAERERALPAAAPPDPPHIPAEFLAERDLTPLEVLLLWILRESAFPSEDDLAELFNVSLRTVQSALADLAARGRLLVIPRSAGRLNRYVVPAAPADPRRAALLARVQGPRSIGELTEAQLDARAWFGSPTHLRWIYETQTDRDALADGVPLEPGPAFGAALREGLRRGRRGAGIRSHDAG